MSEKNLDFDRVVNRKGSNCLKYDFAVERGMPEDILPLWVADMDFPTSSYIQDAIIKAAEHGIFGYSDSDEAYFNALKKWMKNRHDWEISSDWVVKTPGVVTALALCVQAYTDEGDAVLLQQPVYYPFSGVILDNKRRLVSSDLVLGQDNRYHIDLDDFEEKIKSEHVKLFLLCSPHNPVGRVWTREELVAVGKICKKYGVTVVCDEIHHDFVFDGKHHVFANISEEFADMTVTCTAPSKTFNIAGLQVSNIIIKNEGLRKAFVEAKNRAGLSQIGIMGLLACQAAYENGDAWYEAMMDYVKENLAFTKEFVEKRLPKVTMMPIEGTYLVWLDFRKLGLSEEELEDLIVKKAGLWLDSGAIFGKAGEGFERINVACPKKTLEEALCRLEEALR